MIRKIMKTVKFLIVGLSLAFTILLTACFTDNGNNHLELWDMVEHFRDSGLNVTAVQRTNPAVFHAMTSCAVEFDADSEQEIGIYKFDTTNNKMRGFLEGYARKKYATTMGIKFPVVISGSFMLVGVEKSPHIQAILDAIESFEN